MDNSLSKAQDVFLSSINQICGKFGLNNIMAQLYAILYLSQKPISLDDMAKRLKISKGSVSINIRALESYGAVARVWVKGSRKDYYKTQNSISRVIMDRVRSMGEKRLSELEDMIKSSYSILDSVSAKGEEELREVEMFRQKVDELSQLYGKAKSLFDLLNSDLLGSMLNNYNTTQEPPLPKMVHS